MKRKINTYLIRLFRSLNVFIPYRLVTWGMVMMTVIFIITLIIMILVQSEGGRFICTLNVNTGHMSIRHSCLASSIRSGYLLVPCRALKAQEAADGDSNKIHLRHRYHFYHGIPEGSWDKTIFSLIFHRQAQYVWALGQGPLSFLFMYNLAIHS